jgi:hypothetical protein
MSEYSPRTKSEQLLRLSDQVNRLAHSLAELSTGDGLAEDHVATADDMDVSEEAVAGLIRLRVERACYLATDLFADPVWDILLFLLHAEIGRRSISASSAALASGLPEIVGRRWLNTMVEHGLIKVQDHPDGSGGELVEIMPEASRNMRRYFREVVVQR